MKKLQPKNIVALTGAGISQESGIKTFRDQNGLWENHPIEEVATPAAYAHNPALVHRFYNLRREQLKQVEPNQAHKCLAELEQNFNLTIITQNVDDLHERAGSSNVIHMHGELRKIRSNQGEIKYTEEAVVPEDYKNWRPHIVWFGENIMGSDEIMLALEQCDLFLCIGTSNQVYPAAGFVYQVKEKSVPCFELNYEETQLSHIYDKNFQGKASKILPAFIREYL